jgi:hypothetical protein
MNGSAPHPEQDAQRPGSTEGAAASSEQMPRLEVAKPWLRTTLYVLGVSIPAAVIADWLTEFDFVTSGDDPMFATVVFTMAVVLWLAPGAFDAATNAYERIWLRGVIHRVDDREANATFGFKGLERTAGDNPTTRYRNFIESFNNRASSQVQWVVGVGFLALAYLVIRAEVVRDTGDTSLIWFRQYAETHSGLDLAVVSAQLLVWGLVGVVFWKVMIIAWETARLSKSFLFQVIVGHPDRSGGLAVLGHMCFRLALIVTVPSILCACWVVVLDNGAPSAFFRPRYATFEAIFRIALAVLIVVTFLVAIRPLRGVHKGMNRGRSEIYVWLDSIAVRLKERTRSLLEKAVTLDPEIIAERTKQIEADQKLISELGRFPTWPFDRATVVKLSASQVVPVFSMLGITGPIVDLVEGLFSA